MNKTGIEYMDFSWNPLAMRCTPVSEGCANCWHIRMADRLASNPVMPEDVRAAYTGESPPMLVESRLAEPVGRRKAAVIGVQFMGDLFHEDVPPDYILRVWRTMYEASNHTFQVLTKRPERMNLVLTEWLPNAWQLAYLEPYPGPLPNVIGMVTAENQTAADEHIPYLLETPFAVRGVSIEPMLGPVDLQNIRVSSMEVLNALNCQKLDWVIVGGESGPGARPMDPDWVRRVRDQCQAVGVPFFFKQWGEWLHRDVIMDQYPDWIQRPTSHHHLPFRNFGKKAAGRLLDGREWNEMPEGSE